MCKELYWSVCNRKNLAMAWRVDHGCAACETRWSSVPLGYRSVARLSSLFLRRGQEPVTSGGRPLGWRLEDGERAGAVRPQVAPSSLSCRPAADFRCCPNASPAVTAAAIPRAAPVVHRRVAHSCTFLRRRRDHCDGFNCRRCGDACSGTYGRGPTAIGDSRARAVALVSERGVWPVPGM